MTASTISAVLNNGWHENMVGTMREARKTVRKTEGGAMPPTLANGKICYIEIPATDLDRSAGGAVMAVLPSTTGLEK